MSVGPIPHAKSEEPTVDYETRRAELIAAQDSAREAHRRAEIELAEAALEWRLAQEALLEHLVTEGNRQCRGRGTVLRSVTIRQKGVGPEGQDRVTRLWIEVEGVLDNRISSTLVLGPMEYLSREVRNRGFAPGTLYVIEGGDQVDTLD
jgi:hypothetical protein